MIPRLKPYLGREELGVFARRCGEETVREFECQFARTFEAADAVAFPYGRSAIWAFLHAVGLQGAEVIQPAYTCVVVAHATVLSGNVPRFVDVSAIDYNMNLAQVEEAITPRTGAIVATHLFGYPLDLDRLDAVVHAAEKRYGRKIWVIHDCAHSFGARWQDRLVCRERDVAVFGLGVSKVVTSIFGGMLTTSDATLAARLRTWRDAHFREPSRVKTMRRRLYLAAVFLAFLEPVYGATDWLQRSTPLLDRWTKAYHLDDQIRFPPDHVQAMCGVEARVGLAQLAKYDEIIRGRRACARHYDTALADVSGLALPPIVDGATYSHYVVRVASRPHFLSVAQRRGVQLGDLIQYSVPDMPAYARYGGAGRFPVSLMCSRDTINLPVYAAMTPARIEKVIAVVRAGAGEMVAAGAPA